MRTTPEFSWITPNNCSDAHDATCKGDNLTGDPNNHQGGLFAADVFLEKYVPMIMQSPAFQQDGMIQVIFDEAFPPYKMYGNSIRGRRLRGRRLVRHGQQDRPVGAGGGQHRPVRGGLLQRAAGSEHHPAGTRRSTRTPPRGGGITGAVFISRFIRPGSISDQPYNHYSWLRSMEDLFGIHSGGLDGKGHLAFAGMDGRAAVRPGHLQATPPGRALRAAPSGSSIYPATASIDEAPQGEDRPAVGAGRVIMLRPSGARTALRSGRPALVAAVAGALLVAGCTSDPAPAAAPDPDPSQVVASARRGADPADRLDAAHADRGRGPPGGAGDGRAGAAAPARDRGPGHRARPGPGAVRTTAGAGSDHARGDRPCASRSAAAARWRSAPTSCPPGTRPARPSR